MRKNSNATAEINAQADFVEVVVEPSAKVYDFPSPDEMPTTSPDEVTESENEGQMFFIPTALRVQIANEYFRFNTRDWNEDILLKIFVHGLEAKLADKWVKPVLDAAGNELTRQDHARDLQDTFNAGIWAKRRGASHKPSTAQQRWLEGRALGEAPHYLAAGRPFGPAKPMRNGEYAKSDVTAMVKYLLDCEPWINAALVHYVPVEDAAIPLLDLPIKAGK
jgi:hypothetical protein